MQLLLQNNQCAFAAPPGNDQEFLFFVCRSKRSRLLRPKENDEGVAALLTRVEGRSSTEGRQLMASYALFHCMDQRVAPPKCLWQMPVALQSEAAPRFGQ